MIYTLYFTSQGAPKTGLTPSITTYKKVSDNSDVSSPPAISEIGGGGYKFTATPTEPYFVVVDGGTALVNAERYKVMQITANDGALDAAISTVTAKTNLIPASPAAVGSAMTLTNAYDAAKTAAPEAGGNLAAVRTVTDVLETHIGNALEAFDPPTKTELDTAIGNISLPEGIALEDSVQAVKAKTDNLPGSPAAVGSAMTLTSAYDAAKTAVSQDGLETLLQLIQGADGPTLLAMQTALAEAIDGIQAPDLSGLTINPVQIFQGFKLSVDTAALTVTLEGAAHATLILKQGEAKNLALSVLDLKGAIVDLSQATVFLGIKRSKNDSQYVLSKEDAAFDKSQAANGVLATFLSAGDTNQSPGNLVGELKVTFPGSPAIIEKSGDLAIEIRKAVTT